jgi:pyruvate/2-oxoglutarate dehydrogenase complex dihydrolipoamide dehydrogenase (E3) component
MNDVDPPVVEKGPLGGTCLDSGCIPSKGLLYHADVLGTVKRSGEFHIGAEVADRACAEAVREVGENVESDSEPSVGDCVSRRTATSMSSWDDSTAETSRTT